MLTSPLRIGSSRRFLAYLRGCIAFCLVILSLQSPLSVRARAQGQDGPAFRVVDRQEILEAMRLEKQKGYALGATTNGGRFQARIYLQLVRWARARDAEQTPLFIDHEHYFWAFSKVTGLTLGTFPPLLRMSYLHGQDQLIEYRTDRIIKAVEEGPQPVIAIAVKSWWPDTPGAPSSYTYSDTLSRPNLRVTNERVVTYRVIDFGDMLMYDDIHGVKGRPTSGVLGLLFDIIGPGRPVYTRIAISEDGLQIVRGAARKGPFVVEATATVYPDGTAEKGIPPDRPDLLKMEDRLKQPSELSYLPFDR